MAVATNPIMTCKGTFLSALHLHGGSASESKRRLQGGLAFSSFGVWSARQLAVRHAVSVHVCKPHALKVAGSFARGFWQEVPLERQPRLKWPCTFGLTYS